MRVAKEYAAYNGRRYGRPWIAKVTAWHIGGRAELAWGTYLGDERGGEVEIEAAVGDVIRFGQTAHRGHEGHGQWALVTETGYELCTEAQAAKTFRTKQSAIA